MLGTQLVTLHIVVGAPPQAVQDQVPAMLQVQVYWPVPPGQVLLQVVPRCEQAPPGGPQPPVMGQSGQLQVPFVQVQLTLPPFGQAKPHMVPGLAQAPPGGPQVAGPGQGGQLASPPGWAQVQPMTIPAGGQVTWQALAPPGHRRGFDPQNGRAVSGRAGPSMPPLPPVSAGTGPSGLPASGTSVTSAWKRRRART